MSQQVLLSQVLTEVGNGDEIFTALARMAASPVLAAGGFGALVPEGHFDGDDGMSLVMARIKSMDEAQRNMIEIKAKYAEGLRDTDHPDWCHTGSGDMVIGMHGGISEVLFNGYGKYDRMFRILAPHENSNDWTHGSWKFRSDFRRLTIGSTVSTIREIPLTDGRFVKTNVLATVSA